MAAPYEIRADEHGVGSVLIAKRAWSLECSQRMEMGDLFAVRLSNSMGFRGSDLSFLSLFPRLRSVEAYSTEVRDLQALSTLRDLEVLGLQTPAVTRFQSEWFPALRVALLSWRKGMEGLLQAEGLRYLNVSSFPFTDLSPLVNLQRLERLALTSRKLTSLEGLERLRSLRQLDLYACPNLTSIAPVAKCPNLVKVEVESCRHIPNQR